VRFVRAVKVSFGEVGFGEVRSGMAVGVGRFWSGGAG